MTGYGRGVAERDGRRAIVEIRSVNHRFLDLKLRGTTLDPPVEARVGTAIRAECKRGSVTAMIRLEQRGAAATMRVDVEAAKRVFGELSALGETLGLSEPINLQLLCAQPGVMVPDDTEDDAEEVAACIVEAVDLALAGLVAMRTAEGEALVRDLEGRLERLETLSGEIADHVETAPEWARRRLEERLGRLLQKSQIELDEARLAQEVAILADRLDVTEELVRLRSHVDQVRQILRGADQPIGRRCEFLVQEMGRELNTIASKSQSADIARTVVDGKAELEKIREQVQNIE